MFTSLLFKWRYYTISIFAWALLTMYSRIYLGVHFITDTLGGALWGASVGIACYLFYIYACKLFIGVNNIEEDKKRFAFPHKRASLIVYTF